MEIKVEKFSDEIPNRLESCKRVKKGKIAYINCSRTFALSCHINTSNNKSKEDYRKQLWSDIEMLKHESRISKSLESILDLARMCKIEKFPDGTNMTTMILICHCSAEACHAKVIKNCINWIVEKSDLLDLTSV